jgi:hypothetical protein
MKRVFFPAVAAMVAIMACNNTEEETTTTTPSSVQTPAASGVSTTSAPVDSQGTATQTPPATGEAISTTPPPVMLNPAPATAATSGANVVKNPPHGQPGHRCDIEVGAPLPQAGAPQTMNVQPAQPQPVQVVPQTPQIPISGAATTAPAAKGGKAVNPAHGQPGHRCDIAVGAPLN